jgi:hypothetical protein
MTNAVSLLAVMGVGVIASFVFDPIVTWVRTEIARRNPASSLGLRLPTRWLERYRRDFKLGLGIVVASYIVAAILYAFGLRPIDESQAFQFGFLWNAIIDKLVGKIPFSTKVE